MNIIIKTFLSLQLFYLFSSFAQLDLNLPRGLETQTYGKNDICVVPRNFLLKSLTFDTEPASKKQRELCSIDFFNDPDIGICPKDFSTNPAVEVYKLTETNLTKAKYESIECKKDRSKRVGKKIGKFKQSITCSYTPSILGYYALSQWLGDAGRVPPSVIRTMPFVDHQKIAKTGQGGRLAGMWKLFEPVYVNPLKYPKLSTSESLQLYGAFSQNPAGEEFYREFYGHKHVYADGLKAFKKTNVYLQITNLNSLKLPKVFNKELAQKIQAMKDASSMIAMDTIMNQQDRFGNVHKKLYYHYLENNNVKTKSAKGLTPEEIAALKDKGAVEVYELLMKDNDCGVTKSNLFAADKTLRNVRHFSPSVYKSIQNLALQISNVEFINYLKSDLLFTTNDLTGPMGILNNLSAVATTLKENCKKGLLKLDLDIPTYLGLVEPVSCL